MSAVQEPQHMQALSRANHMRLARCALKRRIAAGETRAADAVLQCPDEIATMTLFDLLTAQRRWGRWRALTLLHVVGLTESKTVGSLTERQRVVVADWLDQS